MKFIPQSESKVYNPYEEYNYLKQSLFSQRFKKINQLFDMRSFINENEKLYEKLQDQLKSLKNQRLQTSDSLQYRNFPNQSKNCSQKGWSHNKAGQNSSYTSTYNPRVNSINKNTIPMLSRNKQRKISKNPKLFELKEKNAELQKEIIRRKQTIKTKISTKQTDQVLRKTKEISQFKNILEKQQQNHRKLKDAIKNNNLFQMYQIMCRQCEKLRKCNNQLSEQLKNAIVTINDLTGKEDNPNMIIMNLKID